MHENDEITADEQSDRIPASRCRRLPYRKPVITSKDHLAKHYLMSDVTYIFIIF